MRREQKKKMSANNERVREIEMEESEKKTYRIVYSLYIIQRYILLIFHDAQKIPVSVFDIFPNPTTMMAKTRILAKSNEQTIKRTIERTNERLNERGGE